jgi:hypothetical protein
MPRMLSLMLLFLRLFSCVGGRFMRGPRTAQSVLPYDCSKVNMLTQPSFHEMAAAHYTQKVPLGYKVCSVALSAGHHTQPSKFNHAK